MSKKVEQALAAYKAMALSKNTYFGFLQELDQKYDKNQSPSIAENLKLEELLSAHDLKVKAFNEAMAAVVDKAEREELMAQLTTASTASNTH